MPVYLSKQLTTSFNRMQRRDGETPVVCMPSVPQEGTVQEQRLSSASPAQNAIAVLFHCSQSINSAGLHVLEGLFQG